MERIKQNDDPLRLPLDTGQKARAGFLAGVSGAAAITAVISIAVSLSAGRIDLIPGNFVILSAAFFPFIIGFGALGCCAAKIAAYLAEKEMDRYAVPATYAVFYIAGLPAGAILTGLLFPQGSALKDAASLPLTFFATYLIWSPWINLFKLILIRKFSYAYKEGEIYDPNSGDTGCSGNILEFNRNLIKARREMLMVRKGLISLSAPNFSDSPSAPVDSSLRPSIVDKLGLNVYQLAFYCIFLSCLTGGLLFGPNTRPQKNETAAPSMTELASARQTVVLYFDPGQINQTLLDETISRFNSMQHFAHIETRQAANLAFHVAVNDLPKDVTSFFLLERMDIFRLGCSNILADLSRGAFEVKSSSQKCQKIAREECSSGSSLYGIPITTGIDLLYGNEAILESIGYGGRNLPSDWNGFAALCRKLLRRDAKGQITTIGFESRSVPWYLWAALSGIDPDMIKNYDDILDLCQSSEITPALMMAMELIKYAGGPDRLKKSRISSYFSHAEGEFISGYAGLLYSDIGIVYRIHALGAKFGIRIGMLPSRERSLPTRSTSSGLGLCAGSSCDEPEIFSSLANFLVTDIKAQHQLARATSSLPVNEEVTMDYLRSEPEFELFPEDWAWIVKKSLDCAIPRNIFIQSDTIDMAMDGALKSSVTDGLHPLEAVYRFIEISKKKSGT